MIKLQHNSVRARLATAALLLATHVGFVSCGPVVTSEVKTQPVEMQQTAKPNSAFNKVQPKHETIEEYGARICKEKGPGTWMESENDRKMFDSGKAASAVICEDHGGYNVIKAISDPIFSLAPIVLERRFNYPKPRLLSPNELEAYIRDKPVVLFGEMHTDPEYAEKFIEIIPKLKEAGFTHIGMELDWTWQEPINDYMARPTKKKLREIAKELGYVLKFPSSRRTFPKIIETARQNGLKVACLDNIRAGA